MLQYGLLGQHLSHSYSPQIHKMFGCGAYELINIEPNQLRQFINDKNYSGINVTTPYKKSVLPYLDSISTKAAELGSVNTIIKKCDGTLYGDNTDLYGFNMLVEKSKVNICDKKVLILGNGGSTPIVRTVLENKNASKIVIVSRSGNVNYGNISQHKDAQIIVNTTPVGMYPNTGTSLICLDGFPQVQAVFDIIYNPIQTKLLLNASKRGIQNFNGLLMLVAQAAKSEELFFGEKISEGKVAEVYDYAMQQIKTNGGF